MFGIDIHYLLNEPVNFLIENYDVNKIRLYNSYETGSYLEFRGLKTYIDSRAELFIKSNNKKDNIFKEYYLLKEGEIKLEQLIEKYNLVFDKNDVKIWVRNDVIANDKN